MRNKGNKIDSVQQYKNLSDVVILIERSDEGSRAKTLQEAFARLPYGDLKVISRCSE